MNTEAHKQNGKIYQLIMRGDELDVIEKGALSGVVADSSVNMTDSQYRKSIENIINAVQVVDSEGNGAEWITDSDSISRYSMVMTVLKSQADKNNQEEARALLKEPEREGSIVLGGDFRAQAGYSLIVRDSNFSGRFWISSDSHSFSNGLHVMKLVLSYINEMVEEKVETEKPATSTKRKRKA